MNLSNVGGTWTNNAGAGAGGSDRYTHNSTNQLQVDIDNAATVNFVAQCSRSAILRSADAPRLRLQKPSRSDGTT